MNTNERSTLPDLQPQLLRDAFEVLDRHSASIAKRDASRSLNEDRGDLLRRVRAALAPLIFDGDLRRDDVAQVVQQIDEVLASEPILAQSKEPRIGGFR